MKCSLLALVIASLGFGSGCKLLGLDGGACDPADAATCPAGQVCNQEGECVASAEGEGEGEEGEGEEGEGEEGEGEEGEGEEGEGEGEAAAVPVVENAANVTLLAVAADGTLFWPIGILDGCIRRLAPGGAPENVACETGGRSISALTVDDDEVVWVGDGAGATDHVLAVSQDADPAVDLPTTLFDDADLAPLANGPNNIVALELAGGAQQVLVSHRDGQERLMTRIERGATGAVSYRVGYVDVFLAGSSDPAAVLIDGVESAFVGVGAGGVAQVGFREIREDDTSDGGEFGTDFFVGPPEEGDPDPFPPGRVHAGVAQGTTAFIATRDDLDSGSLMRFSMQGTFNPAVILDRVDADNPRVYAAAIATDGFALYYTTAGTLGPNGSFGVFRIDLFSEPFVAERLIDLDVPGAGIVVSGTDVIWAEPANNRIMRLALP